jgi:1-acyl-sn-glycerol-3-phosphate acyltransferase
LSVGSPNPRQVFFRSLRSNRRLVLWYASKLVLRHSAIETVDRLQRIDQFRKEKKSITFICNHLTYADSHIIETLLIRNGFRDLAKHLIHIAGQKTYEMPRRWFTRSLNTIRVYQPKAPVEKEFKRKMNSRALKWAAHLKKHGYSLLVFPEGTRTRKLTRFNPSLANPKTTVYFKNSFVVPLALMGAEKIMPVGQIFQSRSAVKLRIGDPVDHEQLAQRLKTANRELSENELRSRLMHEYMMRINELLDPDYQSAS